MKKQHAAERLGLREQERDLETEHSFGRTYVVDGQRWCIGTVCIYQRGRPHFVWAGVPILHSSCGKVLRLSLILRPKTEMGGSVCLLLSPLLARDKLSFIRSLFPFPPFSVPSLDPTFCTLSSEHGRCRVTVSLGRFPCMS